MSSYFELVEAVRKDFVTTTKPNGSLVSHERFIADMQARNWAIPSYDVTSLMGSPLSEEVERLKAETFDAIMAGDMPFPHPDFAIVDNRGGEVITRVFSGSGSVYEEMSSISRNNGEAHIPLYCGEIWMKSGRQSGRWVRLHQLLWGMGGIAITSLYDPRDGFKNDRGQSPPDLENVFFMECQRAILLTLALLRISGGPSVVRYEVMAAPGQAMANFVRGTCGMLPVPATQRILYVPISGAPLPVAQAAEALSRRSGYTQKGHERRRHERRVGTNPDGSVKTIWIEAYKVHGGYADIPPTKIMKIRKT